MRASADKSGESGGTRSDIAFGPRNIRSKNDLIGIFARHRTAAHLLMVLMIIAGFFGLNRMTTQFFPDFGIDVVLVTVSWPGASAGDVDGNIVQAIEREVRFVDSVKAVKSSAFEGRASVAIEFEAGSDMQSALSNIETAVGQVTTLPEDAETPTIRRIFRYDTLSRILVSGPFSETALKTYAKQIRDGLLRRGVDKVDIGGARNEEILVEIRPATLRRLELTLNDVARKIRQTTQDVPSGDVSGRAERQLRSIGGVKTARELGRIEIKSLANGEKILLRDIATVREAFDSDGRTYWRGKNRAIQLHAKRTPADDALILADEVEKYLEEIKPTLPPNLKLERYDVQADLIRSRISLLLSNGATGLIIVLVVLFLFLNGWVAFWVAVGIPISLAATMMAMWLTDQSINMVSLFALIMTIGIIVDDTIVVGEHSESLHRQGYNNSLAAEAGARRMATPVLCASLTTIAAFLPLLLITDVVGSIIRTIPLVVIAVILASLIECFLVLPGHMRHALGTGSGRRERSGSFSPLLGIGLAWIWPLIPAILVGRHVVMPFKRGFDRAFEGFRERLFLPLVRLTIRWRYTTAALAIATLIGAASVVAGGRINFVFFPNPEVDNIFATAEFSAGTPRARTQAMVAELERALHAADRKLTGGKGGLVRFNFSLVGAPLGTRPASSPVTGNHVGGMFIQLVPADQRTVVSGQFISAWRKEIRNMPGLQQVNIKAATGGPPGRDVDVRLTGASTAQLKQAAQELKTLLRTIPGVRAIEDSQPYGKIESILELTPRGRALGFTTESVGRQVRNIFRRRDRQAFRPRRRRSRRPGAVPAGPADLRSAVQSASSRTERQLRAVERHCQHPGKTGFRPDQTRGRRARGGGDGRPEHQCHDDPAGYRRNEEGRARRSRQQIRISIPLRRPRQGTETHLHGHGDRRGHRAGPNLRHSGVGVRGIHAAARGHVGHPDGFCRRGAGPLSDGLRPDHPQSDRPDRTFRHRGEQFDHPGVDGEGTHRRRRTGLRRHRQRGARPAARHHFDLGNDHRRPDATAVRDRPSGAVPDPHGDHHGLRPDDRDASGPDRRAIADRHPGRYRPHLLAPRSARRRSAGSGGIGMFDGFTHSRFDDCEAPDETCAALRTFFSPG